MVNDDVCSELPESLCGLRLRSSKHYVYGDDMASGRWIFYDYPFHNEYAKFAVDLSPLEDRRIANLEGPLVEYTAGNGISLLHCHVRLCFQYSHHTKTREWFYLVGASLMQGGTQKVLLDKRYYIGKKYKIGEISRFIKKFDKLRVKPDIVVFDYNA